MSKTPKKAKVKIAEAVGAAGTAGRLGPKIEGAMVQAVVDANALGITDDTRDERLIEITGEDRWAGLCGADYIREKKIEARLAAKAAHRELEEAERVEREAARQGNET